MNSKTPIQRAFDLARTGAYENVLSLTRGLQKEGYDARQIEGPQLKKQLLSLIREAKVVGSKGSADRVTPRSLGEAGTAPPK